MYIKTVDDYYTNIYECDRVEFPKHGETFRVWKEGESQEFDVHTGAARSQGPKHVYIMNDAGDTIEKRSFMTDQ